MIWLYIEMGVMGDGSCTRNTSASSECGSATADFLVVLPNKQITDPKLYHILIISVLTTACLFQCLCDQKSILSGLFYQFEGIFEGGRRCFLTRG